MDFRAKNFMGLGDGWDEWEAGCEVMSGVFEGMIDELGNKEVVVKKMSWG